LNVACFLALNIKGKVLCYIYSKRKPQKIKIC